jgi:hypothetical protein
MRSLRTARPARGALRVQGAWCGRSDVARTETRAMSLRRGCDVAQEIGMGSHSRSVATRTRIGGRMRNSGRASRRWDRPPAFCGASTMQNRHHGRRMIGRMIHRILPLVALLFVCFAAERSAHAGKGFLLITSGDEIRKVADLKPEFKEMADEELGPGVEVGYKYEHFGLFFLEVWAWDGKYVLFREDEYWDPSEAEVAEMAGVSSVDELGKPWQYTFKPGLLIIVVLAGGLVAYKMLSKDDDDAGEGDGDGQPAQT